MKENGSKRVLLLAARQRSCEWLRLSNRIHKSDLVQIVRSVADGTE